MSRMAQLLIQAPWSAKLSFEGAIVSCWPLLHGHRQILSMTRITATAMRSCEPVSRDTAG